MSWLDEIEAKAKQVKAGLATGYHLDELADGVLKLVGLHRGAEPAAAAAPVATVEVHVEGAEVPAEPKVG